ncbi:MAG TPA: hypothetical protein VL995_12355 [Cellvibrio sp.]|nr:hypothetical protein [Cellvibrio sp.]
MSDLKKISSIIKPLIQKMRPINPQAPANLQDSYLVESSKDNNKIESNQTAVERRSINEAKKRINEANLQNAQDVEALKKQLGIEHYSTPDRIRFYLERLQKESTTNNNGNTIANLDGLVAYELNGMSMEDTYSLLPLLIGIGDQRLNQMRNSAQVFPGLGANSQIFKILHTITAYEHQRSELLLLPSEAVPTQNNNFLPPDIMEQSKKEQLIVMWNRSKFLAKKHFIVTPAQEERLFRSSQGSYGGHPDNDPFPTTTTNTELAKLVWDEFRYEGSCASINIWDNAIFSWGRGFAGKGGGLMPLLNNLYADPHFRRLFQAVGIDASQKNSLAILTNNSWIRAPASSPETWNYIKGNPSLILFFIALGEIKNMPLTLSEKPGYYLKTNSDLQFAEVVKTNGIFTVPDSQLEQWKADFGYDHATKTWPTADQEKEYKQFVQLNAHIFHWLPVFGKKGPMNILMDKNGKYYKASIRNTLIQFADRAAADPINQGLTDLDLLNNNQQETIFYNSLLQTKPITFQPLIMDRGHFMSFGGDMSKNVRVNLPVENELKKGMADGSVIEFERIDLIDHGQRHLGYQVYIRQQDGSMSVVKLNQKKFQGAAIYYIFEKNAIKKGYVITVP